MGPEVGASVHDGHTGNVQEHPGKGGYVRPSVHTGNFRSQDSGIFQVRMEPWPH